MDRRWHILLFLLAVATPLGLVAWIASFAIPLGEISPPRFPAAASAPSVPAPRRRETVPLSRAVFGEREESRLFSLSRSSRGCALLESPLAARAPLLSLFHLLPAASDSASLPVEAMESYLRALGARNAPEFEAALRSASHPLLDLTEASILLGLLPAPAARRDPRAAIALLRAAAESDSQNAAPSLLLAYALKLVGENGESVAELERALSRPVLKTYSEEVLQSLTGRTDGKPASLSAALALASRLPGTDLWPLEDLVLDALVDGDGRLAELAYAFGARLEKTPAFSSGPNFGFGQRIAATAWRKLHPAQSPPARLAKRPAPAKPGLLVGLTLPLARGLCETELPRFAARLRAEQEGRGVASQ